MRIQRLGCLTPAGLVAALLTALILAGTGMASGGALFSPGDLNAQTNQMVGGVRSHAELSSKCAACHTAPWDSARMADRCMDCHTDIRSDLTDPKTVHGSTAQQPGGDNCLKCHTEHHGLQANLTRLDIANYPHDLTGYSLQGHPKNTDGSPFACIDCHEKNYADPVDPTCLDCHSGINVVYMKKHTEIFGQACLDCHDGVDRYGKAFDHNKTQFALSGNHAQVECAGCHQAQTSRTALQNTTTDCASCHQKDDAHQGALGTDCAACHTADGWKPATFDHSKSGFQLTGKHQQIACVDCHADQTYKGAPSACAGCHQKDDVHKGSLGLDCAGCHNTTAWKPSTFDHNKSAFPLTGAHISVTCSACHTDQVFKGTPANCFGCHSEDDHHQGQFGTECAACHATDSWSNITFDHAKSQFPLTGAHSAVPCQRCHSAGFRDTPTACISCHEDPKYHAGMFASDCAQCHTTAAWLPAAYNGSHTFPRSHGGASSCRSCHPSALKSYTCYTCHNQGEVASEHNEEGIADFGNCMACHPNGEEGDD